MEKKCIAAIAFTRALRRATIISILRTTCSLGHVGHHSRYVTCPTGSRVYGGKEARGTRAARCSRIIQAMARGTVCEMGAGQGRQTRLSSTGWEMTKPLSCTNVDKQKERRVALWPHHSLRRLALASMAQCSHNLYGWPEVLVRAADTWCCMSCSHCRCQYERYSCQRSMASTTV